MKNCPIEITCKDVPDKWKRIIEEELAKSLDLESIRQKTIKEFLNLIFYGEKPKP